MGDICEKGNETDKEKVQDRIRPLILPCSHLYLHQKDSIVEYMILILIRKASQVAIFCN